MKKKVPKVSAATKEDKNFFLLLLAAALIIGVVAITLSNKPPFIPTPTPVPKQAVQKNPVDELSTLEQEISNTNLEGVESELKKIETDFPDRQ